MKDKVIISFMLLTVAVFMATGCGTNSETEEANEEIVEEISEANTETEEITEEPVDIEEVTEEETETTETEETISYTLAEIQEALDPDVHLTWLDATSKEDDYTDRVVLDETATEMAAYVVRYEGDESASLRVYANTYDQYLNQGIMTLEEAADEYIVKVQELAQLYYQGRITKDEYNNAIIDPDGYALNLLASGVYAKPITTNTDTEETSTPSNNNNSGGNNNTPTQNTNTDTNTNTNTSTNNNTSSGDEIDENAEWVPGGAIDGNGNPTDTQFTDGSQYGNEHDYTNSDTLK